MFLGAETRDLGLGWVPMYSGRVVIERAQGGNKNWVDQSSPKMAEFRSTQDIFCKMRLKEVFRVSVDQY